MLAKYEQDFLYQAEKINGNNVFSGKIRLDNYLKFLIMELKPFINSRFSILKIPLITLIAGSSVGGIIFI
jgi:predicted alpha/beta superfamily hydrolase